MMLKSTPRPSSFRRPIYTWSVHPTRKCRVENALLLRSPIYHKPTSNSGQCFSELRVSVCWKLVHILSLLLHSLAPRPSRNFDDSKNFVTPVNDVGFPSI
ncbi:hypothetical protein ACN38_g3633 [Penicillium nordicum]|uniref:Uncharacterized protein n=1 Tax=Penicillium nordicum TaxID=229535 RepID=A0A0M9WHS6_9EURO|nr:hypothetical protein ACN38_g3633 [Penicillium nordicum]